MTHFAVVKIMTLARSLSRFREISQGCRQGPCAHRRV